MKIKELAKQRTKTVSELEKEVLGLRAKLSSTKTELLGGKESNLKAAQLIRRDIAQNLSIIGELKRTGKTSKNK